MGEVRDGFRQGRMEGRIAAVRRSAPSAPKLKFTFAVAAMAAMVQNAWLNCRKATFCLLFNVRVLVLFHLEFSNNQGSCQPDKIVTSCLSETR